MELNWTRAVVVGGPSAIITYIFHSLILSYMGFSELVKSNFTINVLLLVFIFGFCMMMGFLAFYYKDRAKTTKGDFSNNEVSHNEVNKDLIISVKSQEKSIKKNKISNNKIGGSMKID